ncbi:tripartite ATP-independent periplasmic (TRAP) C4-dicarboxylate transporter subunit DctQ [Oceaniovalibus guishaninsula JLT2003]|uniref:TRAP transporter small permease protein n=1 Tax=Oceaniovalibus guishaninsula JLT2003 TaxID=1231392 RepID=K2H637_9RHOB|nr:TRAP transporter small permease [Oceaniovalibus guishaninsula]EKE43058.1 tripartite ATP-independent periplasmic (TRAP) C4-dicarboxylate transporter subunit DctQ [Oceaniovalibus guishaninsula JLT2003]
MGRAVAATLEIVSAVLLIGLIGVTVVDVIGRYVFDAPLTGAFEITELLLGALVFAALPLVSRAGEHVEVDILAVLLPARVSAALLWLAALLAAVVLAYFAWQLFHLSQQQRAAGSVSMSLGVPLSPLAVFGAAACLLAAIYGFVRAMRA